MNLEIVKNGAAWIMGLLMILLGSYGLYYYSTHYIIQNVIFPLIWILFGFIALPPINIRIQKKIGVDLPDYHIIGIPIIAWILVFASLGFIEASAPAYYADFSDQEIKQNSTKVTQIGYIELIRNFKEYEHNLISYRGKVTQVMNQGDGYIILIATSRSTYGGYSENYILTDYSPTTGEMEIGGQRPVKGDIMKVWGEYTGPHQYTTALGSTNTVPATILWHAERMN